MFQMGLMRLWNLLRLSVVLALLAGRLRCGTSGRQGGSRWALRIVQRHLERELHLGTQLLPDSARKRGGDVGVQIFSGTS